MLTKAIVRASIIIDYSTLVNFVVKLYWEDVTKLNINSLWIESQCNIDFTEMMKFVVSPVAWRLMLFLFVSLVTAIE